MERRSSIENQMNVIIERLIRPGGAGLYDNLLDSEAKFLIVIRISFVFHFVFDL